MNNSSELCTWSVKHPIKNTKSKGINPNIKNKEQKQEPAIKIKSKGRYLE